MSHLDLMRALRSHQVSPGEPWEWKKYLSVPFSSRNCRAFPLERRWRKTGWAVAAIKFLFPSLPCHFCHPSVTHSAGYRWRRRWGMEVVALKSWQLTLSYFILKGIFYASKEASIPYPLCCFTSSFVKTETFRGPPCTQTTPADRRRWEKIHYINSPDAAEKQAQKTHLIVFQ